jgi:DNA polymerase-4
MQSLRWLYVDFNSYFASVEQQLRPELRGKPIAVVPVETDSTSAIAASYEAKAFGVKTGTKIYEAKRLAARGTSRDFSHDKRRQRR